MKQTTEIKAKRPKHATKWILCTKWGFEAADKAVELYWAPIGDKNVFTKTGLIKGRIYEFDSELEATNDMNRIANLFEDLRNTPIVVCEVRYVPHKIKMYGQEWFDRYVLSETNLKITGVKRGSSQDLNP